MISREENGMDRLQLHRGAGDHVIDGEQKAIGCTFKRLTVWQQSYSIRRLLEARLCGVLAPME